MKSKLIMGAATCCSVRGFTLSPANHGGRRGGWGNLEISDCQNPCAWCDGGALIGGALGSLVGYNNGYRNDYRGKTGYYGGRPSYRRLMDIKDTVITTITALALQIAKP